LTRAELHAYPDSDIYRVRQIFTSTPADPDNGVGSAPILD
jgi:hypothetical protein